MTDFLQELEQVIATRKDASPDASYVARMLQGPEQDLYRKLPEEATEVVMACQYEKDRIAEEVADLWFMSMLALAKHGVPVADVTAALAARRKCRTTEGQ